MRLNDEFRTSLMRMGEKKKAPCGLLVQRFSKSLRGRRAGPAHLLRLTLCGAIGVEHRIVMWLRPCPPLCVSWLDQPCTLRLWNRLTNSLLPAKLVMSHCMRMDAAASQYVHVLAMVRLRSD